jgi:acyl-CoA synthetase (AMP-forming)/AMP-acid ligase II
MGEQVGAFVRPAAGRSPDPDRLAAFCREHLAAYKAPRIWQIVDEFPQTASGKIQKFILRDRYLASLEGSDAAPTAGRSTTA